MKKIFKLITLIVLAFFSLFIFTLPVSAQISSFKFIAWGDTKGDTATLTRLSIQAKALNPAFTIYAGDLESAGFTASGMNTWKNAVNGGVNNGLFNLTFPVRGNHDAADSAGWQGFFNLSAQVTAIGGTNYSALNDDLTYSFDYGNARIIGIDVPGNAARITSAQIAWLDQRLTDAESRGLQHAFFFWHGPIYYVANHTGSPPPIQDVINRHPIVSAGFFGHEHSISYTHINSSRVPGITNEFEQVVSGDAGAGPTTPTSSRVDYWLDAAPNNGGFVLVTVNGGNFTLDFYKGGTISSQRQLSFSNGTNPPPQGTPTITPTLPPGATRTPTPTQGTGPTRTPTPTVPHGQVCTFWKN